ncbi:MAG: zinc metallopeptidase [Pirellulales bacterium]|nr:zinc metallopeptidase [Pirellulales bacterium]
MFFNPVYLLYVAPAFLLGLWAQMKIHSSYAQAQQIPAPLSGAAAARHILDSAGLQNVEIEEIPGKLTDHYDPREKVLRLSREVYAGRSLAAVGIAAHESGHALQDAQAYAPLTIRNAAVPMANIGSGIGMTLFCLGLFISSMSYLLYVGIALYGAVVFFQVVNLPVEFNASRRAKAQLVQLGIIDQEGLHYVSKVLSAAALTYVAATLQAILTLVYLLMRANDRRE